MTNTLKIALLTLRSFALEADVRNPFSVELKFTDKRDANYFMTQVKHDWPRDEMVAVPCDYQRDEFQLAGIKVKVTS